MNDIPSDPRRPWTVSPNKIKPLFQPDEESEYYEAAPLSPNGALPMIPPRNPEANEVPQHPLSPPMTTYGKKSGNSSPRKIKAVSSLASPSHAPPEESHRLDMRHDDDEFAYTAHLILNQLRENNSAATSCYFEFADLWAFVSTAGQKTCSPRPRSKVLTRDLLAEFKFALKHRMKFVPLHAKTNESDVSTLTRQVARAISKHGYPRLPRDRHEEDSENQSRSTASESVSIIDKEGEDAARARPTDTGSTRLERIRRRLEENQENVLQPLQTNLQPALSLPPILQPLQDQPLFPMDDPSTMHIRQQYSAQHQPIAVESIMEPVYEIDPTIMTPAIVEHEIVAEPMEDKQILCEYLASNLVENSDDGIYVGIDRSFEEEIVVLRETTPGFPVVHEDEPLQILEPEPALAMEYVATTQKPASEQSMQMQQVMDETKRVTRMLKVTSHERVKRACHNRLHELRIELEGLAQGVDGVLSNDETEVIKPTRRSVPEEESKCSIQADDILRVNAEASFQVLAPANLPGNYQFEAQLGEDTFLRATVPKEGIQAGEIFKSPLNIDEETHKSIDTTNQLGMWKDKICDFFRFGPHVTIGVSIFFPLLALGQVMTRLQVRWIALPSRSHQPKDAFRIAIVLTMFWITVNCLLYYLPTILAQIILFPVLNFLAYAYYVLNVIRTRRRLRRRYMIPTTGKAQDAMLGICVPQLVVMQMLRHTCDYETYSAHCCTATGISSNIKIQLPSGTADDSSLSTMSEPLTI